MRRWVDGETDDEVCEPVGNRHFMSYNTSHLLVVPLWLLDLPAVTRMLLWASIILSHRDSEEKPANWTWGKTGHRTEEKLKGGEVVVLMAFKAQNLVRFHLIVIVS